MKVRIFLRDTVTNFTRIYESTYNSVEHLDYDLDEGNSSCDHNRILYITDWGKEGPEELKNNINNEDMFSCVTKRIIVDKVLDENNVVIYQEP